MKTKYIDGTYEVSIPCKPDEDEDFTEYQLSMKVTIRNDKIVSITDVSEDGDAANDSYIKKAANGTSSKKGVVSQIITKGMPEEIDAARYHSLAADTEKIPKTLKVIATADDGEVMAVQHKEYPVYGLQFHPESILTPKGRKILENFLGL